MVVTWLCRAPRLIIMVQNESLQARIARIGEKCNWLRHSFDLCAITLGDYDNFLFHGKNRNKNLE